MTAEVAPGSTRARPPSGGLRTFLSWLRRDDRSPSIESFSSGGSDRTVTSFAFLPPAHYLPNCNIAPTVLPPPGPPTDSYRKRIRDRDLRRHLDRDLTLGKKYRLPVVDNISDYDAFSLPSARRSLAEPDGHERARRATSECLQRRAPYVPGKRHAPPPPSRASSLTPATSPTNRKVRKRQAPQPPANLQANFNEDPTEIDLHRRLARRSYLFSSMSTRHDRPESDVNKMEKRSEKNNNCRNQSERNFLKQIFEGKKRISVCDPIAVRLLPNISELDRQAAEILQMRMRNAKAKVKDKIDEGMSTKYLNNHDNYFEHGQHSPCAATENCTDNSIFLHNKENDDEKQQLKRMLKEMKDSLPKSSKSNKSTTNEDLFKANKPSTSRDSYTEADIVTLRIGSSDDKKENWQWSPLNQVNNIATVEQFSSPNVALHKNWNEKSHQPVTANRLGSEENENKSPNIKKFKLPSGNVNTGINRVASSTSSQQVKKCEGILYMSEIATPKESKTKITSSPIAKINIVTDKIESNITKVPVSTSISTAKLLTTVISTPPTVDLVQSEKQDKSSDNLKVQESLHGSHLSQLNVTAMQPKVTTPPPAVNLMPKILLSDNLKVHESLQGSQSNAPAIQAINSLQSRMSLDRNVRGGNSKDNNKPLVFSNTNYTATSATEPAPIDKERCRNLVIELEHSIAKGDENGAANAAMQLAQLRLPRSIFSLSLLDTNNVQSSTLVSSIDNTPVTINKPNKSEIINIVPKISSQSSSPTQKKPTMSIITISSITNNAVPDIIPSTSAKKDVPENINIDKEILLPKSVTTMDSILQPTSSTGSNLVASGAGTKYIQTQGKSSIAWPNNSSPAATVSSNKQQERKDKLVSVEVWVEDREAARGPVRLHVTRDSTLRMLRRQAEITLGLPTRLQRWIVGHTLCTDDDTTLQTLAGPDLNAPFYLCLVESELNKDPEKLSTATQSIEMSVHNENNEAVSGNVYIELMQLERCALVPNAEVFECGVCIEVYRPGEGVVLRECVHTFCRECLAATVQHCAEPIVACPATGCAGVLQEREIRALVSPEEYERWLARGLAAAESGARHSFHCKTNNCTGWALCEPGVQRFPCPVCKHTNCVPCQAIHEGRTCEQHHATVQAAVTSVETRVNDEGTRALLDGLLERGEALECPECNAIITKKWGCDWVRCSACKTEICWVTRGRRWGPAGRGDTSAGCRCGVDGKRCHPSCGYCH